MAATCEDRVIVGISPDKAVSAAILADPDHREIARLREQASTRGGPLRQDGGANPRL